MFTVRVRQFQMGEVPVKRRRKRFGRDSLRKRTVGLPFLMSSRGIAGCHKSMGYDKRPKNIALGAFTESAG